jgi:Ankyrin repeats (3 copies)
MIGFTMIHVFPWVYLLGILCWMGLIGWLIFALVQRLRKRFTFSRLDVLLVGVSIATLACPLIPESTWAATTTAVLGLSPHAPTYLVHSAQAGDISGVRQLLAKGVSANSTDNQGCSTLAAAAGSNKPQLVALLLEHHANPDATCSGEPAIMRATNKGDLTSIKLLVEAGADINARDKQGFTAYDSALMSKRPELIQFFESRSAH